MRVCRCSLLVLALVLVMMTSLLVTAGRVRRVSGQQSEDSADSGLAERQSSARQPRFLLNLQFPRHVFPYYQKPNYRYPYYNGQGDGVLVYGYGDERLYTYNEFKTLFGYYRR